MSTPSCAGSSARQPPEGAGEERAAVALDRRPVRHDHLLAGPGQDARQGGLAGRAVGLGLAELFVLLLALAWWGWSRAGLALLQLNMSLC